MQYILLFIEILLTVLLLFIRHIKYHEKKSLINPKSEDWETHNLIKSGKTKRLVRERQKYINTIVTIIAIGLVAICATLFWYSHLLVEQHRKDGLIGSVF